MCISVEESYCNQKVVGSMPASFCHMSMYYIPGFQGVMSVSENTFGFSLQHFEWLI